MKPLGVVIVTAAALISTNTLSETVKAIPPDLQKAADCMYDILKREPGFDKTTLGTFESEGFVLPYLQYFSPADKYGRRITVRFGAELACSTVNRSYNCCPDKNRYCFLALLSGISVPPNPGPPDGDVNVIANKWNAQCGVYALAVFA